MFKANVIICDLKINNINTNTNKLDITQLQHEFSYYDILLDCIQFLYFLLVNV